MLAECLWRPNSGCEHSEVVGGVFQQWRQRQSVASPGADCYNAACRLLATAVKKCVANGLLLKSSVL